MCEKSFDAARAIEDMSRGQNKTTRSLDAIGSPSDVRDCSDRKAWKFFIFNCYWAGMSYSVFLRNAHGQTDRGMKKFFKILSSYLKLRAIKRGQKYFRAVWQEKCWILNWAWLCCVWMCLLSLTRDCAVIMSNIDLLLSTKLDTHNVSHIHESWCRI